MVTLHHSLMYLKEAVVKVQSKTIDFLSGISIARKSCDELKKVKEDIDGYTEHLFQHSKKNAEKSVIDMSMPCISKSQQHQSNPEHSSTEDYLKKMVAIAFVDHLNNDISSRFNTHAEQAALLEQILPVNIVFRP